MIDFFLENGKINVALTKDNDSATGTANNDAYQIVRAQINDISKKMNAIYQSMGDSSLSDEQKEAKQKEGAQLEEQYDKAIKEGVQNNITNPVGVFLFKQTFYNNSTAENEALLQQIPSGVCISKSMNLVPTAVFFCFSVCSLTFTIVSSFWKLAGICSSKAAFSSVELL